MSDKPNETPLCFCTEDQIVDELRRRNQAVVVAVARPAKGSDDDEKDSIMVWCRGGQMMTFGLVAECYALFEYRAQHSRSFHDAHPDEP